MLDDLELSGSYAHRIASLREFTNECADVIDTLGEMIAGELEDHDGYQAIQAICGVGPVIAAVFVAEIGDVTPRGERPAEEARGVERAGQGDTSRSWQKGTSDAEPETCSPLLTVVSDSS